MGGRLHELKGVGQLFAMLAHLRTEFPDLRLMIMGREDVYRGFEPQARALGVDDLVVSTGWLEGSDLACAYAALDVAVSPSICFETFGMTSLEAAEFEKPVVTTSFGGCPEVVVDGRTGFVENPFDVPAFAGRIAQLLRAPELCREMGRTARRRLEAEFTVERLTDEFLEEYELARNAAATENEPCKNETAGM